MRPLRQLTCLLVPALLLTACSSHEDVYRSAMAAEPDRRVASEGDYDVTGISLRTQFPSICREDSWVRLRGADGKGKELCFRFDYHSMTADAKALREGSRARVQFNGAGRVVAVDFLPEP